MTDLVTFMLVFLAVGAGFVLTNLTIGKLLRPYRPDPEKQTIYECGEPTVGSAWIQFDLRFYVVALLFVIFDVEMAFFFPWAVVFGTANRVADEGPAATANTEAMLPVPPQGAPEQRPDDVSAAGRKLAWLAFADIVIFFGVLLVGFAYLWKRGDLEWVRSTVAQAPAAKR
jgi:NADH-quinone oxidoreductase subunit A